EVAALAGVDPAPALAEMPRLPWFSRSVDSNYLTGKRVFVFGDATHAIAAARPPRGGRGGGRGGGGGAERDRPGPARGGGGGGGRGGGGRGAGRVFCF